MTKDELLKKAVYIQYPLKYDMYKDYSVNEINKLPLPKKDMMYDNWSLNQNHFKNEYHIEYAIPLIDSLLHFGFNEDDFVKTVKKINNYDIPILVPKKDFTYEIYGFNHNEHYDNLKFNDITSCSINSSNITDYHKMYKYPHECSRLINKSLRTNRILFLSGDSQMIPIIGILICYFKEIWYIDNRNGIKLQDKWNDIQFTDVLIELNCNELTRYTQDNFK